MNIFDTHFHLPLEEDLPGIVKRASDHGVNRMLVAGTSIAETAGMLDRIGPFKQVYAAVGVHPHEADEFNGEISNFRQCSLHPQVHAIGEIGLDYYYNNSSPNVQQRVFNAFLNLALEADLPTIIHCRDAFEDCYQLVKERLNGSHPFVIHCFTGSREWADRFIELGGYLSFNGILTFKKSNNIRELMRAIPLDRLLLETDSPYLAPDPHRGKKNEPANMVFIVERAAKELGIDVGELAEKTTQNAIRFFKIPLTR